MKKGIKTILFLFSLLAFIYSSVCIVSYFGGAKKQEDIFESMRDNLTKPPESLPVKTLGMLETLSNEQVPEVVFEPERRNRQQNLFELYKENNDLIGWITIDGLVIDYPVMQTISEPDFYLKNDFNKKKSSFGCIYMDANCRIHDSKNFILYGHHMKNGSMFAAINHYDSEEYYLEHPIIQFDSLSLLNDFQIIGAFKSPASDLEKLQNILLFNTTEEFEEFKEYFDSHKFYNTDISYSYEDTFLTLMTCEYTNKNGRFFVIAKKIK